MPRAVRFTFEYVGLNQPRVLSTLHLEKRVVASDARDATTKRSGFWFDVLDNTGAVLYRRVTGDPRVDIDAPADEEGRMASAVTPGAGMFSVVLPNLPRASRVRIWASSGGEQSKELLSIPFPGEH